MVVLWRETMSVKFKKLPEESNLNGVPIDAAVTSISRRTVKCGVDLG